MRVRDIMTPSPLTISRDETLAGAMELMAMKHVRHLPVVDAAGALVGLLTDRDLRRAAPSPLFQRHQGEGMEQASVERVMLREPLTVDAGSSLRDAVQLLVDKKYGALPVIEGGRLVGILTPVDVMRAYLAVT